MRHYPQSLRVIPDIRRVITRLLRTLFCILKKMSGLRKLPTFYFAKNDHRWVTFICLKTINASRERPSPPPHPQRSRRRSRGRTRRGPLKNSGAIASANSFDPRPSKVFRPSVDCGDDGSFPVPRPRERRDSQSLPLRRDADTGSGDTGIRLRFSSSTIRLLMNWRIRFRGPASGGFGT